MAGLLIAGMQLYSNERCYKAIFAELTNAERAHTVNNYERGSNEKITAGHGIFFSVKPQGKSILRLA